MSVVFVGGCLSEWLSICQRGALRVVSADDEQNLQWQASFQRSAALRASHPSCHP